MQNLSKIGHVASGACALFHVVESLVTLPILNLEKRLSSVQGQGAECLRRIRTE